MTARRLLTGAAMAFGLLLYALVFVELFLRVMAPQPLVPRYVSGGSGGIRDNIPNVAFRQWTSEVDVTVRYNDRGMRDDRPAPPLARPAGTCRVALVGDSYFVGFESDYPSSFAKRLEDGLNAAGVPARVLNFAVSGFGTAEDLITIRDRVAPWRPDLIIMSWHASDSADNVRSRLFRVEAGRPVPAARSYLPGVTVSDSLLRVPGYRWLIENSHAYSAIRESLAVKIKAILARPSDDENAPPAAAVAAAPMAQRPLRVARPGTPPLDTGPFQPPRRPGDGNVALDRALVFASRDAARQAGATFMLYEIPVASDDRKYYGVVDNALGDLPGIVWASPLADFRGASPDRKFYLQRGHRHWTADGNAVAARVAVDAIGAAQLLRGCTAAR